MIYFDNAASSYYKPKIVKDRVMMAMENCTANPGRGSHKEAIRAATEVSAVRAAVASLFDAEYTRVIFTHNCTTALNMAIIGILQQGDHVITSTMEHNSVLRPLHMLKTSGMIELDIVPMSEDGVITATQIAEKIKDNTKVVVLTHTSNVTGATNPIREIGELCHSKNIKFIVDAAQGGGHSDISIKKDNIDILCFAGHKGLFSLASIGGLVLADTVELHPIILGGTGVDSINLEQASVYPENFESGTISTPLIISLGAGVEYLGKNKAMIYSNIAMLTKYLFEQLRTVQDIKLYSNPSNCSGVVSFNLGNNESHSVGAYLDENFGICTRTGLHCAPLIHQQLGIANTGGCIRVSLSHKNTFEEINVLIKALKMFSSK